MAAPCPLTTERIDELLSFLPGFERPGRSFVARWTEPSTDTEGVITLPYPVYEDDVLAFFAVAGRTCWSDFGYDPRDAQRMLADDEIIATASLATIKTMLTYCVRGERFCDGFWDSVLTGGRVTALLRRLAELRASTQR